MSSQPLPASLPDDPPSQRFRIWSRGNIGEVFPDPISPLNATASFLRNLEPGWRLAMEETRTILPDDWEPDVPHIPIACFGGYLYLNVSVSRLAGVRFGLSPEAIDQQFSGGAVGIPSYASEARDTDTNPAATAAAFQWLIGEVLPTRDLARFEAQRSQVEAIVGARPELREINDADLLQRIIGFDDLFRELWQSHILATNVSVIGLDGCASATTAAGRPELTSDADQRAWRCGFCRCIGRHVAAQSDDTKLGAPDTGLRFPVDLVGVGKAPCRPASRLRQVRERREEVPGPVGFPRAERIRTP